MILDRFIVHFFSSAGVVLCAFFGLHWVTRKWSVKFLPQTIIVQLVIAAVGVFAFASLREAWDVYKGQTIVKAFFDYASWLLGCGFSTWALIRFREEQ